VRHGFIKKELHAVCSRENTLIPTKRNRLSSRISRFFFDAQISSAQAGNPAFLDCFA